MLVAESIIIRHFLEVLADFDLMLWELLIMLVYLLTIQALQLKMLLMLQFTSMVVD